MKSENERPVGSISPHTPNRKCLHQRISEDGKRVDYYHVTKGWKSRRIVEPSIFAQAEVVARLQSK